MAPTVATALRAAALCAWLVLTSGQVCPDEVTAEDVEELLTNPQYERLRELTQTLRQSTMFKELLTKSIGLYECEDECEDECEGEGEGECGAAATRAAPEPAPEPCTCDQVEIRGSAEVEQLQQACLGSYTRREVSWSDNPVFVNDEDDGLFLSVSGRRAWVVWWRDTYGISHSGLATTDRLYEDADEDEDEEKPPSSFCPSDGHDWRVRNDTDLSWNRLPLSVVCSDEPWEPAANPCCERVRVSAGGAYDGIYESSLEPSAGHRRVYWNAAESLLLTYRKNEANGLTRGEREVNGRWSVLPKNADGWLLEMDSDSIGLPCPSDPEARWEEGDVALFPGGWRSSLARFECVSAFPTRCCRTFSLRSSPDVEALQPQSFGEFRFWRTTANGPVYKSTRSADVFLFPHPISNAWFTSSDVTDRTGPHLRVFADAGELGRERLCPTEIRRWQISLVDITDTSIKALPSLPSRSGPVTASCVRSQNEIRQASDKAAQQAGQRRQTSNADGDDQTNRQKTPEPDDDEFTDGDVGAFVIVIALLMGILLIVARSCAPVIGAVFASASTRVRAPLDACMRTLRELTLPKAVRAARRRQQEAAPLDSRAARREEAAKHKADAQQQQEAAKQQAEADRQQKEAEAEAASVRRAEKAAAKREEVIRAHAAAAARSAAQEAAVEHLYSSLEQEAMCAVVRDVACEAVREVKLEHAAGDVFEAMLFEVATATARSLAPAALAEAAEQAKMRAKAAVAAHAELAAALELGDDGWLGVCLGRADLAGCGETKTVRCARARLQESTLRRAKQQMAGREAGRARQQAAKEALLREEERERREAVEAAQSEAEEERARRLGQEMQLREAEALACRRAEEAQREAEEEEARWEAAERARREAARALKEKARREASMRSAEEARREAQRSQQEIEQRRHEETRRRGEEEAAQRRVEEEAAQRRVDEEARREVVEEARRRAEERARREARAQEKEAAAAAKREAEAKARREAEARRQAEALAAVLARFEMEAQAQREAAAAAAAAGRREAVDRALQEAEENALVEEALEAQAQMEAAAAAAAGQERARQAEEEATQEAGARAFAGGVASAPQPVTSQRGGRDRRSGRGGRGGRGTASLLAANSAPPLASSDGRGGTESVLAATPAPPPASSVAEAGPAAAAPAIAPAAPAIAPATPPAGNDEGFCVVCMAEERTHLLVPCGHKCLCEGCATMREWTECPICRAAVLAYLRVREV